jgi:ATP-binding cassette subfamily A (ABC1) protein 3
MDMKNFLKENIIGYCPQFDAVDEYLTGKEALYIYARLIGINEIQKAIVTAINRFKLQSFVDVPIIKYSGGMKRTLSVAVAMLGDPQIILLDEPTNGMVTYLEEIISFALSIIIRLRIFKGSRDEEKSLG